MAVYVDNFADTGAGNFGRMKMSHLVADSQKELLEFVDKIGVQRKWIQDYNSPREHFDICLSKKAKAIKLGAIEIHMQQLSKATSSRKSNNEILIIQTP